MKLFVASAIHGNGGCLMLGEKMNFTIDCAVDG